MKTCDQRINEKRKKISLSISPKAYTYLIGQRVLTGASKSETATRAIERAANGSDKKAAAAR